MPFVSRIVLPLCLKEVNLLRSLLMAFVAGSLELLANGQPRVVADSLKAGARPVSRIFRKRNDSCGSRGANSLAYVVNSRNTFPPYRVLSLTLSLAIRLDSGLANLWWPNFGPSSCCLRRA